MKPEVGMGATMRLGSDCYPYTIIWINEISSRLLMQPDHYQLIEGNAHNSEHQVYTYTANPAANSVQVSRRKDGSWRIVNEQTPVSIGNRRAYRDPSF